VQTVITEESIQTLVKLGLSASQAKIYLNLVVVRSASVNAISKASEVDRGETYRVMSRLMDLGLVEKMVDSPIRFKAIPIQEGISILFDRRNQENMELQKQAQKILEATIMNCDEVIDEGEPRITLIPAGDHLANLLSEKLGWIEESYNSVTFVNQFERFLTDNYGVCEKLLARGVKLRFIVENQEAKDYSSKSLLSLLSNPNFSVIFVSSIPACMAIYDDREVRISVSRKVNLSDAPMFFSDNSVFLAIVQSSFDALWSAVE
jgi:sugar-specific transcriptional regulator TrmB